MYKQNYHSMGRLNVTMGQSSCVSPVLRTPPVQNHAFCDKCLSVSIFLMNFKQAVVQIIWQQTDVCVIFCYYRQNKTVTIDAYPMWLVYRRNAHRESPTKTNQKFDQNKQIFWSPQLHPWSNILPKIFDLCFIIFHINGRFFWKKQRSSPRFL